MRPSLIWLALFPLFLFSQSWNEKTLSELTLDEKIGQLFMLPICPLREEDHREDWAKLLKTFHVGNAILQRSDPRTQIQCLNALQERSKIPLLIAADAEWGLAMRMENTAAFPKNGVLGKLRDLDLIFQIGKEIGRQAKRVGIHLNLAPVADMNTNPKNPIIGIRSFGDEPYHVASSVAAMIRGMQSAGILACAKHFPGHGDTSVDSHIALPILTHSRKRLESVEWIPFRRAIAEDVGAIMSGHLLALAIDPDHPATLSPLCIEAILRSEWGFDGLIITDALNMKALSQTPEEIAIGAFQAGCDLLLYGDHLAPNIDRILREDFPKAWRALKRGFMEGTLHLEELDRRVARILRAKERLKLPFSRFIDPEGVMESLHEGNRLIEIVQKRIQFE